MKAMVLAAGLGTRLRPLTDLVPKPLAPLLDRPLLGYTLSLLAQAGVRKAVVNAHHLAGQVEAALAALGPSLGMALHLSPEPEILGTGGGLWAARRHFEAEDVFLLVNGDVLFDCDLAAAVEAHRARGAVATMVLAPMPKGAAYAAVECDGEMNVLRVAGRGLSGDGAPYHFTGVHVLSPRVLQALPEGVSDINRAAYPALLAAGERVVGHLDHGSWSDLGAPASYLAANLDVLAGRVALERFGARADPFLGMEARPGRVYVASGARVEPGAELHGPCWIGSRAVVRPGAKVGPAAVVGSTAEIGPGASVAESVVWAGAWVRPGEVLRRCVAANDLRVPASRP